MTELNLERRIEAILFASGAPVPCERLAAALGMSKAAVYQQVQLLAEQYGREGSALQILRLEDSFQLATLPQYAPDIRAALVITRNIPLSQAALEVLAVISYNQPVTKAFVEQIRGVDCSAVLNSLVEKRLVEEAGRLELPGRPISYRTTDVFLRCFGLENLENQYVIADFTMESGYEKGREMWKKFGSLDGILCATDSIAIGVMQYLKEQGMKIPEDVMVTGHGDSLLSKVVTPTLTTIRYSYEESGRFAASMLLEILEKGESSAREIKMGYELVEKESTNDTKA